MPAISVMLKPASSDCNLNCDYCFYREEASRRSVFSYGKMPVETALAAAKKAMNFAGESGYASFTFQGGEPLLAGTAFYERFFDYIRNNNPRRVRVSLSVQTNGTLINDDFARIFKRNDVLVGLSLDGTFDANLHRRDSHGENAFYNILRGAEILKKHGVDFNILTVVTKETTLQVEQILDFFKQNDFRYLQFIPCLPPPPSDESAKNYAPTAEEFAAFLKRLFLRYERDFYAGDPFSERRFDNYVSLLLGNPAEQCGMGGVCAEQYVIESDGSVFPCDFYCTDRYRLGNILNDDFFSLRNDAQRAFLTEKADLKPECNHCPHLFLCRGGGCKRASQIDYCAAYRAFFDFAAPRLKQIAAAILGH